LDEANFVNQVVGSNEILETANEQILKGEVKSIDLLGVQRSIDSLESVFFTNGIRDEVISPV